MARPEKPVDRTVPACAELADFLRARRKSAGLTYEQMSQLVGGMPSKTTFERAASGSSVPAWDTVERYVALTMTRRGEDSYTSTAFEHAHGLWIKARRATRAPYYLHKAPDPSLISNRADFSRALRDLHVWAGSPSPGEMEAASTPGVLPKTSVYRIIRGRTLPVTPLQAKAFLAACYVATTLEMEPWFAAAARAFDYHPDWVVVHEEMRRWNSRNRNTVSAEAKAVA
ncbi:helix-turn-helix domain-containing protein [Streptomyces griseofuscus]|uniref:Uncharacterized protein n=1 Tax=Streptomyces rochei TaxID=1928 RepID=A0A068Q6V6_STRRO|nr:helix-turn-helix transcriptional regulator [Streptomyces rochei]BAP15785.1 hypothetical protein [Streptomyces rochei]